MEREARERSFMKVEEKTLNKLVMLKGFKCSEICVTCLTFYYREMWPYL